MNDWLFIDQQDGFDFDRRSWHARYMVSALQLANTERAKQHRLEAFRREIVCRLEGREKETAHWHAQGMFLQNLFRLPALAAEDDHD